MSSLRGQDDYLPGNIIEIELHNFMTFDHLTCKPCSRLNLVIGPNGSGKSSIVCAIALGLGGEPQVSQIGFDLCLAKLVLDHNEVKNPISAAAWKGNDCWSICQAWRGIWIH